MTSLQSIIADPNAPTTSELYFGQFDARMELNSVSPLTKLDLLVLGPGIQVSGDNYVYGNINPLDLTVDNVMLADGTDSGVLAAGEVFYWVYLGSKAAGAYAAKLALCETPPSRDTDGILYLPGSTEHRYVGAVWCTNAGGGVANFADSPSERYVSNYYNRRRKSLFMCPGYADNNANTTLAVFNSATYAALLGGAGDFVGYIDNEEDAVELSAVFTTNGALTGALRAGISVTGVTFDPIGVASLPNLTLALSSCAVSVSVPPGTGVVGRSLAYLVAESSGTNVTFLADYARTGAAADPPATFIAGSVLA